MLLAAHVPTFKLGNMAARINTVQIYSFQNLRKQEVDEENIEDNSGGVEISAGAASKSEIDLNSKFEEFWRLGQEKKNKKKAKEATMLAPRHTTTEPLSKICPLTTSNSNP
uniref:Uncharacterized protein n=1 Tax=Timema bartmani TaxID=61472 RepID=A0A7R9EPQ2_9NEOP|nr:unnamed protein product [Timema bartmani]